MVKAPRSTALEDVSTTRTEDLVLSIDYINRNKSSGLRILNLLRMAHTLRQLFKAKLRDLVLENVVRIQRFVKPIIRKAKRAKGVYYVELKLDIAVAKKVEVFGDFQASRQWKVRLPCEKVG
jgi:molybdate-binding protein